MESLYLQIIQERKFHKIDDEKTIGMEKTDFNKIDENSISNQ